MKKRLFCAVMTVLLVWTMLPVVVGAADAPSIIFTQTTAPGVSPVKIDVKIANNPGFVTATIPVTWDNNVLTLTGIEGQTGGVVKSGWVGREISSTDYTSNGTYYLAWDNDLVSANFTGDGTLCTMVFNVKDTTAETTNVTANLSAKIANMMNYDMEDLRNGSTPLTAGTCAVNLKSASGGGTDEPDPTPSGAKFIATATKAVVGKTFDVVISIQDNPGIASFGISVDYSKLSGKISLQQMIPDTTFDNTDGDITQNPYTLSAYGAVNKVNDGVVATLRFKVADDCSEGTYTIDTSVIEAFDERGFPVSITMAENITVKVAKTITGDVNGDGSLNRADLIKMARYFANYTDAKDLDKAAADVNGDSNLNRADLIMLARYFAGYIKSFD